MTSISSHYTPNSQQSDGPPSIAPAESLGTTESQGKTYYYFKVGTGQQTSVYMFESSADREQFLEWLSLTTGKNISDLTPMDISRALGNYTLVDDYQVSLGQVSLGGASKQTVWMTFIKAPLTDKVNNQVSHEFFGNDAPYFTDGSAPYLNNRDIELTGNPNQDGAKLAGLAGSARFLFESNYGNKQTTPVDKSTLNPGIQELAKSLFGDVPLTQEHLNIMKMMGFVKGDATQGAQSWTLSEAGVAANNAFKTPGLAGYLPSINLNNLSDEDRMKAAETSMFFTDQGFAQKPNSNPPAYYGPSDVEAKGRDVYKKMNGADEPHPQGLTVKDGQTEKLAKLIADLLGLPANTTFDQLTPSQINAAIATGLVSYDPQSNTLSITLNGEAYAKAKAESSSNPSNTPQENPDTSFYNAASTFYQLGGPTGADRAEVNDGKGVKNDRFGMHGIGKLANASPTDDAFWKSVGLGHLSVEDRTKLINASKVMVQHGGDPGSGGRLDKISNWGGGNGLGTGVFTSSQFQGWLDNNKPK